MARSGAFENTLADEDLLEPGHKLVPEPMRTTEFASALPEQKQHTPLPPVSPAPSAPASGYAPPTTAASWKAGRFTGVGFPLQPDGGPCGVPQTTCWSESRHDSGNNRVQDLLQKILSVLGKSSKIEEENCLCIAQVEHVFVCEERGTHAQTAIFPPYSDT
jgi:hypothetical protein